MISRRPTPGNVILFVLAYALIQGGVIAALYVLIK